MSGLNDKFLKNLAGKSISAMFIMLLFSFCITKYNDTQVYVSAEMIEEPLTEMLVIEAEDVVEDYQNVLTGEHIDEIGETFIRINKPDMPVLNVSVQNDYNQYKIFFNMETEEETNFLNDSIAISEDVAINEVAQISCEYKEEIDCYLTSYQMILNHVYEPFIYENDTYYYIMLKRPQEIYDRVIVVDAGHGGEDWGTSSKDGKYYEKDINLEVVELLKKLLEENESYHVYYTRLEDMDLSLSPRSDLANDVEADIFLSVHCNGSEYISAKGIEVLYGSSKNRSGKITSKRFAQICLDSLEETLNTRNRGLLKQNEIYIINHSTVPVALVEIGFMTNDGDMKRLKKKSYKEKVAQSLYNALEQAFLEIEDKE